MEIPQSPQIQSLLDCLSCPVCYETIQPPIRICVNGHNICSRCRSKTRECPVCRGAHSPVRNRFAESAFELLVDRFKCRFVEDGCTQEAMLRNEVPQHEASCEYRPIICTIRSSQATCNEKKLSFGDFKNHILKVHKLQGVRHCYGTAYVKIKPFKDVTELFDQCLSDPWTLNFNDCFFVVTRHYTKEFVYFWAVAGCTKEEALKYSVNIVICNESKSKKRTWSGPVHSIRKQIDLEKDFSTGAFLRIPLDAYTNFGEKIKGTESIFLKHFVKITPTEKSVAMKRRHTLSSSF